MRFIRNGLGDIVDLDLVLSMSIWSRIPVSTQEHPQEQMIRQLHGVAHIPRYDHHLASLFSLKGELSVSVSTKANTVGHHVHLS
jgi:hypothetical protein